MRSPRRSPSPPSCDGNGPEHCCWIPGATNSVLGDGVCWFLELDTVPGRHWVCGLRRELGDWQAVYADPRYEPVAQVLTAAGSVFCGEWAVPGQCCYADVT